MGVLWRRQAAPGAARCLGPRSALGSLSLPDGGWPTGPRARRPATASPRLRSSLGAARCFLMLLIAVTFEWISPPHYGPTMIFSLFLLASVVPTGQSFTCTPVAVWDGDGPIWCAEGPHVRLSGVAAREMNGSCSMGHPCPDADPVAARDHLVGLLGVPQGRNRTGHILVRGPAMRCLSRGGAGGTRTAAFCTSPRSGDITCAMVQSGLAARWDRYWGAHRCD